VKAAFVGFEVIADFGALGKIDVAVDDGAADARMAADVYVVIDDGVGDFAVTVDRTLLPMTDFWTRPPEMTEPPATMESSATPMRSGSAKTNFAGDTGAAGAKRPIVVIKIEDRGHAHEIHIRLVVGIEGADVAQ